MPDFKLEKGQTISSLVREYNKKNPSEQVTVDQVLKYNKITDKEARKLQIGKQIHIPTADEFKTADSGKTNFDPYDVGRCPAPDTKKTECYIVRPGDSLSKIAKEFGVSVNDLRKANPYLKEPKYEKWIYPGDKIEIPNGATSNDNKEPKAKERKNPTANSTDTKTDNNTTKTTDTDNSTNTTKTTTQTNTNSVTRTLADIDKDFNEALDKIEIYNPDVNYGDDSIEQIGINNPNIKGKFVDGYIQKNHYKLDITIDGIQFELITELKKDLRYTENGFVNQKGVITIKKGDKDKIPDATYQQFKHQALTMLQGNKGWFGKK